MMGVDRRGYFAIKIILFPKDRPQMKLFPVLLTCNSADHSRLMLRSWVNHYAALNDKGHFRFPECVVPRAFVTNIFFRHAVPIKPHSRSVSHRDRLIIIACYKFHTTPGTWSASLTLVRQEVHLPQERSSRTQHFWGGSWICTEWIEQVPSSVSSTTDATRGQASN